MCPIHWVKAGAHSTIPVDLCKILCPDSKKNNDIGKSVENNELTVKYNKDQKLSWISGLTLF